jgi:hypothetical protein
MAGPFQWLDAVERVRPLIFRITTPIGSGTGFLVSRSEAGDICAVATAAHVISYAHEWEQSIKLEYFSTEPSLVPRLPQSFLLRPEDRVIHIDHSKDTAAIVFNAGNLNLPAIKPHDLIEEGNVIKVGVEVGWMGFPAVSPNNLCFFSGRISCLLESESAYLVDGVAINGVSGGPAIWLLYDNVRYIGVVSAYIPNRATGEVLPGLAVVRHVSQFHGLVREFKSLDDARRQQQIEQQQTQQPQAE